MAILESEDAPMRSSLSLELGAPVEEGGRWQPYRLVLQSGRRQIVLEEAETALVGRCVLGLEPRNEVALLTDGFRDMVAGRRQAFRFEPQEPNWSLEVSSAPGGWTVHCWVDAGNPIADHYTWDAMGIRFFTDTSRIRAFLEALEAERTVS